MITASAEKRLCSNSCITNTLTSNYWQLFPPKCVSVCLSAWRKREERCGYHDKISSEPPSFYRMRRKLDIWEMEQKWQQVKVINAMESATEFLCKADN